jgi:hypothetical protein
MKLRTVLSAVCIMISSGLALTPRFSPSDVVRQVHSMHSTPRPPSSSNASLDDGDFLIDTSITLVPAPSTQSEPAVAFDGANFLLVWEDYRNGSDCDIYGARVTPQGTVLDSAGVVISHAANDQRAPAVSFDGANFLVVWEDSRDGSDCDIYGARVTPQGAVLDSAGIAISHAANDQRAPAVSFDGANSLVVWEDYRGGSDCDIYGARVAPQGAVLDSAGIIISHAAHSRYSPAIAFDGANFLVGWREARSGADYNIYGTRVTPQGAVLDTAGIVISQAANDQYSPVLAFDGASFLAVWQDYRNGTNDIYGARVTPQGAVLDTTGIVITHAAHGQYAPTLAFDGAEFLVAWRDFRSGTDYDIYGARVTPQGAVLDTTGIVISHMANDQWSPAVGFDGANFLVAWQDCRSRSDGDIYGGRMTPQGTLLDSAGVTISQVVNDQWSPATGFDGTDFLVVWEGRRHDGGYDVYGARVTPEGNVLDSTGIVITQVADSECSPALAFDGVNFLVVWQDERIGTNCDICGRRVSPQGVVLDSEDITISQAAYDQCSPALGFDGTNFLVAWQDKRNGIYDQLYCTRVTPQGTVLDSAGIHVSPTSNDQRLPVISFDRSNFLVVWADGRSGTDFDIYGARVTSQGTVLDRSGIAISRVANTQYLPVLAFDGTNFLAVWADYRSGSDGDIYGARMTQQGTVLDSTGIAISQAAHDQWFPTVVFDGTNFLVMWGDNRSGNDWDIYGARVTLGGMVFGGGSVVTRQGDQTYPWPRLCCGNGSQMLLVYQGWAGTIGSRTYNADRIWGKVNPNPGIEESFKPQATDSRPAPTIIRGVLFMHEASSCKLQAASLLDISGRKVLDLKPGANDVRALAPGVYFVREAQAQAQAVRKIVITR